MIVVSGVSDLREAAKHPDAVVVITDDHLADVIRKLAARSVDSVVAPTEIEREVQNEALEDRVHRTLEEPPCASPMPAEPVLLPRRRPWKRWLIAFLIGAIISSPLLLGPIPLRMALTTLDRVVASRLDEKVSARSDAKVSSDAELKPSSRAWSDNSIGVAILVAGVGTLALILLYRLAKTALDGGREVVVEWKVTTDSVSGKLRLTSARTASAKSLKKREPARRRRAHSETA